MPRYDPAARTVVLTGSTGGPGSALAKALRARGANLALVDLDADRVGPQATALGSGTVARGWTADVRELDTPHRAIDSAATHFGRIDVVVAGAGIGVSAPLATLEHETFERVVDINLTGVWHTFRAGLPHVRKHGGYHLPRCRPNRLSRQHHSASNRTGRTGRMEPRRGERQGKPGHRWSTHPMTGGPVLLSATGYTGGTVLDPLPRRPLTGPAVRPDTTESTRTRSHSVAIASTAESAPATEVPVEGSSSSSLTGELIAWGAQQLATTPPVVRGVVGPVEAFGSDTPRDGCAEVGLTVATSHDTIGRGDHGQ